MTREEYFKIKDLTYSQLCEYFKNKYGTVPFKYGCAKNREKTDIKGLFIHHIAEDTVPSLSNAEVRKESDPKYQEPEMLVYCDYLEHALLHLAIVRETNCQEGLGINGLSNYLIPGLKHYFCDNETHPNWNPSYYERIKDGYEIFSDLLEEYNSLIRKIDLVFEHNDTLFKQVEELLNTNNLALAVLGTGLGKTTLAMAYIIRYNCKALVIGPSNLIKSGWNRYNTMVDTITYSGFANRHEKIDLSKYDIVILDEVHHAGYDSELGKGAKVWGKAIQYLIDNNVKLLGLTATPDRTDGIMIGETFFKDCTCEGLSIEEAIEKGIVHPFSYITAIYDTNGITDELKSLNIKEDDEEGKRLLGQLDLALNNRPSVHEIFAKYMPKNKRKGIIFVQDIDAMELAKDIFSNVFPNTQFRILHSKMSKEEIKTTREWFEETEEGYLLAVNMISEGAHYKGVNTIIMFRKTESYVLYTQQIGRIITLSKNENPEAIVFDLVNNINSISYNDRVKNKEKRKISSVFIKALRKTEAAKSNQIIIADETQDIVERYKQLKEKLGCKPWEKWEDEILYNNYEKIGLAKCTNLLKNRTSGAIWARAKLLNLQAKSHYWSDEEITIIKESYSKQMSPVEISKILVARKPDSIRAKAKTLGLTFIDNEKINYEHWSKEEDKILMTFFEKEGKLVAKRLKNRNANACIRRANFLNLKNPFKNNVWTNVEDKIIYDNYVIIGAKGCQKFLKNRSTDAIQNRATKLGLKFSGSHEWIKSKKIKCIELNKIFNSAKEAEENLNIKVGSLRAAANGDQNTAGGYHWKYIEMTEEEK